MVSRSYEASSIEEVVAKVDAALKGNDVSGDFHSIPTLALKLCCTLLGSLSDAQRQAVDAARRYLERGEQEDADRWISGLASRVGRPYPPGTEESAIAVDRLIWTSLNRNGPLSAYGVEFVLSFGETAGIQFDQLLAAVREVLPEHFGPSDV
jgi:hypothetical protein